MTGPGRATRAKDRSPFEGGLSGEQWRAITLAPLGWPEVWQWIRRNLPVLTRFGSDQLLPYFSDLGPELERWDELARALARQSFAADDDALAEAVRKLSDAPIDVAPAPPLFGEAVDVAQPPKLAPLTIAVAGPYKLDREREFARSITAMAAHFAVSGRVVRRTTQDDSSSLARLLPTGTPFAGGATGFQPIASWLTAATADGGLDVVVLDFAVIGDLPPALRDLIDEVAAAGTLIVAAGGNDAEPAYPAWLPDVLAVGALDDTSGGRGRRPIRRGSSRCSATSRSNTPTCYSSTTPRCCASSSTSANVTTTASGYTPHRLRHP